MVNRYIFITVFEIIWFVCVNSGGQSKYTFYLDPTKYSKTYWVVDYNTLKKLEIGLKCTVSTVDDFNRHTTRYLFKCL